MSAWTCRHLTVRPTNRLFRLVSRIPYWKGLGAESEEKHEPASDIDTEVVDSLKALDPDRPTSPVTPHRLSEKDGRKTFLLVMSAIGAFSGHSSGRTECPRIFKQHFI